MAESQRFKNFLEYKKISQKDFAEKIAVTKGTVNNWVKNNGLPSGKQIQVILDKFPEFNVIWWFNGNGSMIYSADEMEYMTKQSDIGKYKSLLGEKAMEIAELKNEKRAFIQNIIDLLKEKFTEEEMKSIYDVFEKTRGIKG